MSFKHATYAETSATSRISSSVVVIPGPTVSIRACSQRVGRRSSAANRLASGSSWAPRPKASRSRLLSDVSHRKASPRCHGSSTCPSSWASVNRWRNLGAPSSSRTRGRLRRALRPRTSPSHRPGISTRSMSAKASAATSTLTGGDKPARAISRAAARCSRLRSVGPSRGATLEPSQPRSQPNLVQRPQTRQFETGGSQQPRLVRVRRR